MLALAGDIGGTKTLLQLATIEHGELQVIGEQSFSSHAYPDLTTMVREFLQRSGRQQPDSACFAVAGPVRDQRAEITYLPWTVDAQQISQSLAIPRLELINDFQGIGYGIEALQNEDLVTLQAGNPEPHGVRAIIGAGTGLGEGILAWQGERYLMLASEGGHSDFAPRNELEIELLRHLLQKQERVSYDDLLSGKGLVAILHFLQQHRGKNIGHELQQAMEIGDAAAAISSSALAGKDPLAMETLELLTRIYGAQAGNLALTCKASGGLYIAGGIAAKVIEAMKSPAFTDAFGNKPPMRELLAEIPVYVVMNPKVGLLGAMRRAVTGYRIQDT